MPDDKLRTPDRTALDDFIAAVDAFFSVHKLPLIPLHICGMPFRLRHGASAHGRSLKALGTALAACAVSCQRFQSSASQDIYTASLPRQRALPLRLSDRRCTPSGRGSYHHFWLPRSFPEWL